MPDLVRDIVSCAIRVRGLVQGVGFRPTVWRLAHEEDVKGFVRNDGAGVAIEATGSHDAVDRFCRRIREEAPTLARIERIEIAPLAAPVRRPETFVIMSSLEGHVATGIVPDAASCPACISECFDPNNRRYGYPFTNCTHCGPRLSIVEAIPYDRHKTTMADFIMCPDCRREYEDPANRRFHAQPNACPSCGPRIWFEDANGNCIADKPLDKCAQMIAAGKVVAVKGIGGFHLACDATNEQAVVELRRRKARDDKPLALMVSSVDMARMLAEVDEDAVSFLTGSEAPIVLLERHVNAQLADAVAPGHSRIGMMLPYTPLHHLLLARLARPLVMTSGNRSSEPQCTTNREARAHLARLADGWLMHDREIANRLDDSVVRNDRHGPTILRRARGFAPEPIQLAAGFERTPAILAFGAELKSTFCFLRSGSATLSQHLGDLEDPTTCNDFRRTLDLYQRIFEFTPEVIAVDKHPDYASSTWGADLARELRIPLVGIQHHHAHLAAVLAEHGYEPDCSNVLGIILDGTGLGDDGTIWGGEFLLGGYRSFERVGHFEAIGLPGGNAAIREPWRNTFAHLRSAAGINANDLDLKRPALDWLKSKPTKMVEQMLERGLNTPKASSAGRLFDAVAGALGLCRDRQTYEGQAAMELEALATTLMGEAQSYPFKIGAGLPVVVSFAPMWSALLHDLEEGSPRELIAARFHRTLVNATIQAVMAIGRSHRFDVAALSGGVFQNRILLNTIGDELERYGIRVLRHRRIPANDGGLSLGQAAVTAAATEMDTNSFFGGAP